MGKSIDDKNRHKFLYNEYVSLNAPLVRNEKVYLRKRHNIFKEMIIYYEIMQTEIRGNISKIKIELEKTHSERNILEVKHHLNLIDGTLNLLEKFKHSDELIEKELKEIRKAKREEEKEERRKRLEYYSMKNRPSYTDPDYDVKLYGKKPKGWK